MTIKCLIALPTSLFKCIEFVFLICRKIRLLITGTPYQNVKCKTAGESFDYLAEKKKERRKKFRVKESLENDYEISMHLIFIN